MNEFKCLCGRDPPHTEAVWMNSREFQQLLKERQPFLSHDITRLVMTFTETSASHKDAVGPCLQGLQDIEGGYRPGTHDPNDPDRRRILHSTDPSQVSGSISSPGTQKSNDLGSKLLCHHLLAMRKAPACGRQA
jgi:hypothetical protein